MRSRDENHSGHVTRKNCARRMQTAQQRDTQRYTDRKLDVRLAAATRVRRATDSHNCAAPMMIERENTMSRQSANKR
jgi:hypothetical protein